MIQYRIYFLIDHNREHTFFLFLFVFNLFYFEGDNRKRFARAARAF